ncbi:MAG: alpha/beta fold hydrolase [Kutzneria sp.]|nr:alpha/beta fold hydrolase [Kutzneria sp.]MBV9845466.1 alpha/beta fold hydrolase [Kutzneria sp.]
MSGIYSSTEGARLVRNRYQELLRRWPVPHDQMRVPTSQGETFVVACGPPMAPPVVLLHGSMGNSARWLSEASILAHRLRLYSVDIIGEPGLSAPSRPPLDSDAYARWLEDVLGGLGVERASFVGESLGGWMALDYAIRRPGRVDRLALRCPGGIGRQKWGVLPVALLLLPFGRQGRRLSAEFAIGTRLSRDNAEDLLLVSRHFRPRGVLPVFGDEALRRLTMPMTVILGARDRMLDSRQTRRRLSETVPSAAVTMLPDAGHLLPDQSEAILELLTSGATGR